MKGLAHQKNMKRSHKYPCWCDRFDFPEQYAVYKRYRVFMRPLHKGILIMLTNGQREVVNFIKQHPDSKSSLNSFVSLVSRADWKT